MGSGVWPTLPPPPECGVEMGGVREARRLWSWLPPVSELLGTRVCPADVSPSYSHYYSNPSYHTLSQCSPNPPPPNKVSASRGVCSACGWGRLIAQESLDPAPGPPSSPVRFQAVSSLSAPRHPSGQAEPMGVITMLLCPLTGSTDENPMTEVGAWRQRLSG